VFPGVRPLIRLQQLVRPIRRPACEEAHTQGLGEYPPRQEHLVAAFISQTTSAFSSAPGTANEYDMKTGECTADRQSPSQERLCPSRKGEISYFVGWPRTGQARKPRPKPARPPRGEARRSGKTSRSQDARARARGQSIAAALYQALGRRALDVADH